MKLFSQMTSTKAFILIIGLGIGLSTHAQVSLQIASESPVTARAVGDKIHLVKKGETLYGIAKKYRVDVKNIIAANDLRDNNIQPGDRLMITKVVPPQQTTRSLSGSSTARMASATGTVTRETPRYYLVKRGDDIFSISDTEEVTVKQLRIWNPNADFSAGERVIVGKTYEEIVTTPPPATTARMAQRTRGLEDLSSTTSATSPVTPIVASSVPAATTPQLTPKAVHRTVAPDGKTYEMPTFNVFGQVAQQLRYGEVLDERIQSTRFYAYHKTLPLDTKVNLLLPDNAGFIEIEVVGRLANNSSADIALSPACVRILDGANTGGVVTITYN